MVTGFVSNVHFFFFFTLLKVSTDLWFGGQFVICGLRKFGKCVFFVCLFSPSELIFGKSS